MTDQDRRSLLKGAALAGASAILPGFARAEGGSSAFYRIATEETFTTSEVYEATAAYIKSGADDEAGLGLPPADSALIRSLTDMGEGRLADMDSAGINMQVLSLWSPGVQIFDAVQGTELAHETNNQLAAAKRGNPDRFAGLATIATQAPERAAQEIDRTMTTLGLNGVLINSHTKGEYLDNPKYWPIFEAAQAIDAAIYLHPRKPSNEMFQPFSQYAMEGPMFGFHIDASVHSVRLLLSGVFDTFPDLTIVVGHMGEGLPFWLKRLDDIVAREDLQTIMRKPSEYFRDNFVITTSAMFWDPILTLSHEVIGADRIMFGVDYPFASSEEGVAWLDAAPLSEADKKKIYETNARRVFNIVNA
jgi:2,3-dihydroxybenzoate decarboxylase